jgi:hypothetical protein
MSRPTRRRHRLSPLAKDVAQAEYMARTFGIYLRSESYDKEVEKYVGKLAKEHGVTEARVLQERATYVKEHPLDWQRKDTKDRKDRNDSKHTKTLRRKIDSR